MNKPRFRVFLMRHGFSVANLRKSPKLQGGSSLFKNFVATVDPPLSLFGKMQTRTMSTNIQPLLGKSKTIVCCSVLFRAMETALLTFPPQYPVYVCPHLKEETHALDLISLGGSENKPFLSIPQQLQERCYDVQFLKRLHFLNILTDEKCNYKREYRYETGDLQSFFEKVVPSLPIPSQTSPINLFIVSHSHAIQLFLKKRTNDKWNHQVYNNMVIQLLNPAGQDLLSLSDLYSMNQNLNPMIVIKGFNNKQTKHTFLCGSIGDSQTFQRHIQTKEPSFFKIKIKSIKP